jgi:hypothetical protein
MAVVHTAEVLDASIRSVRDAGLLGTPSRRAKLIAFGIVTIRPDGVTGLPNGASE